jgi:hypothetical protein
MVSDPAEYRWSSYGEAMGGGPKGNGRKARAGLVRAIMAHQGYEADARHWAGKVSKEYRMMLLDEGEEKLKEVANEDGEREVKVARKGMKKRRWMRRWIYFSGAGMWRWGRCCVAG